MGDKEQLELNDNFIDQKMAEAFGFGEEQLADELDQAMAAAKGQLPKAPDGELQRIMDRLDRENVTPVKKRKTVRLRRLAKVLIAAAVLATLLVSGSMWVGAKKYYSYEVREKENTKDVLRINNEENLADNSVDVAYAQIEDELNIKVLELSYLPDGMLFSEVTIFKKRSLMEFSGAENSLFFIQGLNDKPSSMSYASDLNECQKIYNSFLDETIPVYQNELEDGSIELSARIVQGNQYHLLEGVIDQQEFEQIVKNIKVYQKDN